MVFLIHTEEAVVSYHTTRHKKYGCWLTIWTVCNKTEEKAKSKIGRRCEEWFEEDGGDQLETNDAGEETMERNNWASQNSQRVVELKEEEEEEDLQSGGVSFEFQALLLDDSDPFV